MAKTPTRIRELLLRQSEQMDHISEILRVKRTVPVENQAPHVRNKSEDYWIGVAHGYNNMVEQVLFEHKCYAGFHTRAEKPVTLSTGESYYPWISSDQPGYEDWRVQYHTKG